jgi:hypothetical protein
MYRNPPSSSSLPPWRAFRSSAAFACARLARIVSAPTQHATQTPTSVTPPARYRGVAEAGHRKEPCTERPLGTVACTITGFLRHPTTRDRSNAVAYPLSSTAAYNPILRRSNPMLLQRLGEADALPSESSQKREVLGERYGMESHQQISVIASVNPSHTVLLFSRRTS